MKICIIILVISLFVSIPVFAQDQNFCGTQILYFQTNQSSSPAGYEELINYPSGNPEVSENVSVIDTSGPVLIDNYIIPEGSLEGTTQLRAGLRKYTFYAWVDKDVGETTLNFTAFSRHADGSETEFYSARSPEINGQETSEYNFFYVSTVNLPLSPTDRLGIRVYAQTTSNAEIFVHWVYQGNEHTSHLDSGFFVCEEVTPIPTIPNLPAESGANSFFISLLFGGILLILFVIIVLPLLRL